MPRCVRKDAEATVEASKETQLACASSSIVAARSPPSRLCAALAAAISKKVQAELDAVALRGAVAQRLATELASGDSMRELVTDTSRHILEHMAQHALPSLISVNDVANAVADKACSDDAGLLQGLAEQLCHNESFAERIASELEDDP